MRDYPQQDHCDLGLVVDDQTEDLRPNEIAPGRCANTAEGKNHSLTSKTNKEF